MSELISGKEALIALANGQDVEWKHTKHKCVWSQIRDDISISTFKKLLIDDGDIIFRLKPRTITLNGIEVPKPFEPKRGDTFYYLDSTVDKGYSYMSWDSEYFMTYSSFGAWRSISDIEQVVAALRSVFKGEAK